MKKTSSNPKTKVNVLISIKEKFKKKLNKKNFFTKNLNYIIIIILIIIAAFLIKSMIDDNVKDNLQKKVLPETIKKLVPANTKITIGKIKDVSNVYEFELNLINSNNSNDAQKYISYITKDGKILFTSGVKLEELAKIKGASTNQTETKKLTCNDLNKSDSPKLTAFVVADCPFGLQTQRLFKQVINQLPALSENLDIKYIGSIENKKITSMHGEKEAEENLRQICIREEQKEKYWPYITCYMQEGKTDTCLTAEKIDTANLQACMNDPNRGNNYAQKDFDLGKKFQISASPTLLLNNSQVISEEDFGGRVANTIKNIICCASNNKADYCNQQLSQEAVAVSFSKTDTNNNSTNSDHSCN